MSHTQADTCGQELSIFLCKLFGHLWELEVMDETPDTKEFNCLRCGQMRTVEFRW